MIRLLPYDPNGQACTLLAVRGDGLLLLDWNGEMLAVPANLVAATHYIDNPE